MINKPLILAIYPQIEEFRVFDNMPPLGMAWIAAVVRDAGYDIHFIDQQVDNTDVAVLSEELKPTIVLIGGNSHTRFKSFEIAAKVKQGFPRATVVYGGPHASFAAKDTLLHIKDIDIVIHGEGEFTSLDLVKWKEAGDSEEKLSSIKGIAFRKNGSVVSTGWRPYMRDLDILPEPARELLPMHKYHMKLEYSGLPATSIITARGCPIGCSYCSASRMFGKHYASRSPKLVVNEIEKLIEKYAIKGFKIFDSTFTLNKNHILNFCHEIERRRLIMPWECEVRVGSIDRTLLERMRNAGCYYIDIGIESGDQEVLNEMGKKINLNNAEDLLKWAEELGVWTKAFFTLGHIKETYESGKKTIDFIKRNRKRIKLIAMNPSIRIYPGTRVEKYALENNLMPGGFRWSKPYRNLFNAEIFLPIDNIPILLQPKMSIYKLRRLRIRYGFMRVLSINYIFFKLNYLLRYGQIEKFMSMIIVSIFKKRRLKA